MEWTWAGSRGTAKLPESFSNRIDSLLSKTHSPSYCCTVLLEEHYNQEVVCSLYR